MYFLFLAISSSSVIPILAVVFGIVLLHEFGHIFVGKHFGVQAKDVTLYLFGGCANMEVPVEPKKEFFIAIGGPLVNVLLILPLYSMCGISEFFLNVFYANLFILFFNILPCFPLDGGRILRSILCLFFNRVLATKIAVRTSEVFCVLGMCLAFKIGAFNLGLICVLVFLAAEAELFVMKNKSEMEIGINEQADQIFRDSQANFLDLERRLQRIRSRNG